MGVRDFLWERASLPTLHFRRARMAAFATTMEVKRTTTVLDVGGTPTNWQLLSERPEVTLLNIYELEAPEFVSVVGDGTHLDYQDESFDIVFSNSVIEH